MSNHGAARVLLRTRFLWHPVFLFHVFPLETPLCEQPWRGVGCYLCFCTHVFCGTLFSFSFQTLWNPKSTVHTVYTFRARGLKARRPNYYRDLCSKPFGKQRTKRFWERTTWRRCSDENLGIEFALGQADLRTSCANLRPKLRRIALETKPSSKLLVSIWAETNNRNPNMQLRTFCLYQN